MNTTTPAYKVLSVIGTFVTLSGNEYYLVQEFATPEHYLAVPLRDRFGELQWQTAMIGGKYTPLYKTPRTVVATNVEIQYINTKILVDDGVTVVDDNVVEQYDNDVFTWADPDWEKQLGVEIEGADPVKVITDYDSSTKFATFEDDVEYFPTHDDWVSFGIDPESIVMDNNDLD